MLRAREEGPKPQPVPIRPDDAGRRYFIPGHPVADAPGHECPRFLWVTKNEGQAGARSLQLLEEGPGTAPWCEVRSRASWLGSFGG